MRWSPKQPMHSDYSKPSGDVAVESAAWLQQDAETLARQQRLAAHLARGAARAVCLLCTAAMDGDERLSHRGVDYVFCPRCGHLQSAAVPPSGYPQKFESDASFAHVYPALEPEARRSRCERVYAPKLDWALSRLAAAGIPRDRALRSRWLDLGAGAGYFVEALRAAGAERAGGIEADPALVEQAAAVLGKDTMRGFDGALAEAVGRFPADIYTAFFVLEHCDEPGTFWSAMAERPKGTVFVFAVPVFGFATLLEAAFDGFAARHLDSVLHTQLYTDESLRWILERSGYEPVAEWIFGQDAIDLRRLLLRRLAPALSGKGLERAGAQLAALQDPLQSALDRARLADARHILAIKR
jgi:2-polyprenyl-3-methyl-5-hydroxy-6-metoxy-1,4-benzoquinol methylase